MRIGKFRHSYMLLNSVIEHARDGRRRAPGKGKQPTRDAAWINASDDRS